MLTDKKMTLQKILDDILELMEEDEDLFLKKLEKSDPPFGKKELENLLNFPWDFGVKTSEEEIDKTLYSE